MSDQRDLIHSPLERSYGEAGKTVEICIYRLPETRWTLEVVDEFNNSTVWDDEFATDQEALDAFLSDVEREGIEAFIDVSPGETKH